MQELKNVLERLEKLEKRVDTQNKIIKNIKGKLMSEFDFDALLSEVEVETVEETVKVE